MSQLNALYSGKAGELAVMSEFLIRGYNVAVPEVDRGDDLFVIDDHNGNYHRIQVKSSYANILKGGDCSVYFKVSLEQLSTPRTPDITYVFAVRRGDRWSDFLVMRRDVLFEFQSTTNPMQQGKDITFYVTLSDGDVLCRKQSWREHRNNFAGWPAIMH